MWGIYDVHMQRRGECVCPHNFVSDMRQAVRCSLTSCKASLSACAALQGTDAALQGTDEALRTKNCFSMVSRRSVARGTVHLCRILEITLAGSAHDRWATPRPKICV